METFPHKNWLDIAFQVPRARYSQESSHLCHTRVLTQTQTNWVAAIGGLGLSSQPEVIVWEPSLLDYPGVNLAHMTLQLKCALIWLPPSFTTYSEFRRTSNPIVHTVYTKLWFVKYN